MVRLLSALLAMVAVAPGVQADITASAVTLSTAVNRLEATITITMTNDAEMLTTDSIALDVPQGYTLASPVCTVTTNDDTAAAVTEAVGSVTVTTTPTSSAKGKITLTSFAQKLKSTGGADNIVIKCTKFTNPSKPVSAITTGQSTVPTLSACSTTTGTACGSTSDCPATETCTAAAKTGDTTTTWPAITAGTITFDPTQAGDSTNGLRLSSYAPKTTTTATFTFKTAVPLIATDYLKLQFPVGTTFGSNLECKFTSTTSGDSTTSSTGKSGGLACSTDSTVYQKCILQMSETNGKKTVECTQIINPVITTGVSNMNIKAYETGDTVIDATSDDVAVVSHAASTLTGHGSTVTPTMELSNDAEGESTIATFKFKIPDGATTLASGDKMKFVTPLENAAATGMTCHSTELGFSSCSYTASSRSTIECTIATTTTGDYGASLDADLGPGEKTVVCEGLKNPGDGAADANAANVIQFGRTDYLTTSGSGQQLSTVTSVSRPKIYKALTSPTMEFSSYVPGATVSATVKFTPESGGFDAAADDKLVVEFPAGTTFKHTKSDGSATDTATATNVAINTVSAKCSITTGTLTFSACTYVAPHLTCTLTDVASTTAAHTMTCTNVVYAPAAMGVSYSNLEIKLTDSAGTTVHQRTKSTTMTKTGTYTGHSRDRVVCVGGGAVSVGKDSGDVPAFHAADFTILKGRSPVCMTQKSGETNGIKVPTLQGNHAGHRFIEWGDKICAAGGGSWQYWKAAVAADQADCTNVHDCPCKNTSAGSSCTSAVSKIIECWDKNPNHGWVSQSMPAKTTESGSIYEGSAPVSWRGMICLTGGATTDIVRSDAGDSTYGAYSTLAADKFTNAVTCTADGSSWKVRTGTLQTTRAFHSAATYGGKMCVSGGITYDGTSASAPLMLSSVECSVDGKKWSYLAALSRARAHHTMFVFQGELCTVGGTKSYKYSMDSFPLECTADGRNWHMEAEDDSNTGLVHSGVSIDSDGTFFVPKLTEKGEFDAYRSYSRRNGWTSVALTGTVLDPSDDDSNTNARMYHMPATFSFTRVGTFLAPVSGDYS